MMSITKENKTKHALLIKRMTGYLKTLEQNNLYENCSVDNAKLAQWFLKKLLRNFKNEKESNYE